MPRTKGDTITFIPLATKLEAERLYIQGLAKISHIARKLNISPGTLRNWQTAGNWTELRRQRAEAISRFNTSTPIQADVARAALQPQHGTDFRIQRVDTMMDACRMDQLDLLERLAKIRGILVAQQVAERESEREQSTEATENKRRGNVRRTGLVPLRKIPIRPRPAAEPQDVVVPDAEPEPSDDQAQDPQ